MPRFEGRILAPVAWKSLPNINPANPLICRIENDQTLSGARGASLLLFDLPAQVDQPAPGSSLVGSCHPSVGEREREVILPSADVPEPFDSCFLVLIENLCVAGHVLGEDLHQGVAA